LSRISLEVVENEFSLSDPWRRPDGTQEAQLATSLDGSTPRLATSLIVYHDGLRLYCLFSGRDDHVVATHDLHDAPLYEEDVVEIFLAPRELKSYYEIEVSPKATLFDAAIRSPNGTRDGMTVDRDWNCEELLAAVRYERSRDPGSKLWSVANFNTVVAVPFSALGVPAPVPGERWRANFFRIDRHPDGDEFTAWRPTGRHPPDFHVNASFGELTFV